MPILSLAFAHRLSLALTIASLQLPPQSPTAIQPPPRYEVASIRPHRSTGDDPSVRRMFPGGRFVATATTVRSLIRIAFGTDDNRISGAPGWIDNETFDINATTADRTDITTPEQFQQFVLSILEDRFQLKAHRDHTEGPIYRLELDKPGKLGHDLKPSTSDSRPDMSVNSNGVRTSMKASRMSMTDVAAALRRQAGRQVEDHTGLKGKFDFQIQWAPEETPDSADPPLFTVLKEQLGLKLRPAKGSIETLVIDQVNHPSDN